MNGIELRLGGFDSEYLPTSMPAGGYEGGQSSWWMTFLHQAGHPWLQQVASVE